MLYMLKAKSFVTAACTAASQSAVRVGNTWRARAILRPTQCHCAQQTSTSTTVTAIIDADGGRERARFVALFVTVSGGVLLLPPLLPGLDVRASVRASASFPHSFRVQSFARWVTTTHINAHRTYHKHPVH